MLITKHGASVATICAWSGIMCEDGDLLDRLRAERHIITQQKNVLINGMVFSFQDQVNIILKHAARNREMITEIATGRDGVVYGYIKSDEPGRRYVTVHVILQISEERRKGYYAYSL